MTLTEAIIVKISHDLAGCIGAFINTVDLMKIDDSFNQEGLNLLTDSGNVLSARLKFFRALYGAENKTINNALVKEYFETLSVKIEFHGNIENRLQLAMVAVAGDILSLGGHIELKANQVALKGKELCCKPAFIQALMGENIPCEPAMVTAMWLAHLAKTSGKHLSFDEQESNLVLTIV